MGTKIAAKANRDGGAARLADPAGHKSIAVDRARITSYDALLRDVERTSVTTAKHHDAQPLSLLHTVPGIGTILSLVLLYEMHDIVRVPRGQDCASSCRLVTCARASAGTRSGTSGATIGNAHRTWAFSEAAVLCLRDNPAGQQWLTRLAKTHRTGKA
jgi:transposase